MQDIIRYSTALLMGVAFASFYFGGLWLTVQRIPLARRPWLWYLGSLLMRTAVVLGGFYVVLTQIGLPQLGVCLAGFIVARCALVYRLGSCVSGEPAIARAAAVEKAPTMDRAAS
jgi:F1F0 ATPase subunit 2